MRLTRKKSLLINLALMLGSFLCCLAGVEVAGCLWERSTAQGSLGWTLVASRRMHLERHGVVDRPYYLFRASEDYMWEGIPVHINPRGFRTEEFALPKPADTYRILNLGDSVVFGWEVRQEDTYGKQLERTLNASNDGRRHEVINAGVPGWPLEAERNFLLDRGLDYEPDTVVLGVAVVNDVYGRGPGVKEPQTSSQALFNWLRDHTYAWPFLTTQARFLMARYRGPEAIPVLNPPRNAAAYYPLDENSPIWDEVWGVIAEMHAVCEQQGIQFIIVVFPTAFQVNSAAHPNTPQRVLAQRAETAGIPFVDLLPVYQQVCDEAGADACEGYENALFADVWMHPNAVGHRLAAEQIAAQLAVTLPEQP